MDITNFFFWPVKQNLVYNAANDDLVGYTDLGQRDNPEAATLATHALTVYVKYFSGKPGLKHPLAYFVSNAVTGP